MGKIIKSSRVQIALILKITLFLGFIVLYTTLGFVGQHVNAKNAVRYNIDNGASRHLLALEEELGRNCTPPAINEFFSDGFTREQRQQGWIVVHAILAIYLFILIAIVCDDYFVPTIKKLCEILNMSEDVAGATFMAAASSSSELFINTIGTFITQGDIGVGTIVGSAIFNILAVPACCGLCAQKVIYLDWWPVSRDSLMYGVAVVGLIFVLEDGKVAWYEALCLVSAYILYISVMYFNDQVSRAVKNVTKACKRRKTFHQVSEFQPLLKNDKLNAQNGNTLPNMESNILKKDVETKSINEDWEESTEIWKWPDESTSFWKKCFWFFTWPISFILYCTTPDCRKHPRLTIVTFVMCILWTGTSSYLVAWIITIIGDTINFPDSVMGLTFLAAGGSLPEAVSSIIVTNQGSGAMGISSSIGSNTFDILLCLGLPWLIKSTFFPIIKGEHFVLINSSGLEYSAIALFLSLVLLYLSFIFNRFKLDWKIGLTCLLMYISFLVLASLIEMNVFSEVNLPTCGR